MWRLKGTLYMSSSVGPSPPTPPSSVSLQPNLGLDLFNPPPPCLSILCRFSPVPASQHALSIPVPAFRSRSEHCSNIPCSKSESFPESSQPLIPIPRLWLKFRNKYVFRRGVH